MKYLKVSTLSTPPALVKRAGEARSFADIILRRRNRWATWMPGEAGGGGSCERACGGACPLPRGLDGRGDSEPGCRRCGHARREPDGLPRGSRDQHQGQRDLHRLADYDETSIEFTISWNQKLTSDVTQAHLHFAQSGVNGGIVVFLCTNLGNGPIGTPACPTGAGEVSGTFDASDVSAGAASQGIDAGQFNKLLRALKAGALYANVHTSDFPSGEIRGQVAFTPTPTPAP